MEDVVPHLVGHHERDLVRRETFEQGVPEHDPLGAPDAGDIGVHQLGVLALVHLVDPGRPDPGPLGERDDAGLEHLVPHRAEAVEQRGDPDRAHDQRQRGERSGRQAGPEPPAPGTLPQQEVGNPQDQHGDDCADDHALGPIAQPRSRALVGEAELVRPGEPDVVGEGEQHEGQEEHVQHAVDRGRPEPSAPAPARGEIAHSRG